MRETSSSSAIRIFMSVGFPRIELRHRGGKRFAETFDFAFEQLVLIDRLRQLAAAAQLLELEGLG